MMHFLYVWLFLGINEGNDSIDWSKLLQKKPAAQQHIFLKKDQLNDDMRKLLEEMQRQNPDRNIDGLLIDGHKVGNGRQINVIDLVMGDPPVPSGTPEPVSEPEELKTLIHCESIEKLPLKITIVSGKSKKPFAQIVHANQVLGEFFKVKEEVVPHSSFTTRGFQASEIKYGQMFQLEAAKNGMAVLKLVINNELIVEKMICE